MDHAIGEIRAGHYDLVFTIPIGNCEHRFREEKSLKQSLIASVRFPIASGKFGVMVGGVMVMIERKSTL